MNRLQTTASAIGLLLALAMIIVSEYINNNLLFKFGIGSNLVIVIIIGLIYHKSNNNGKELNK